MIQYLVCIHTAIAFKENEQKRMLGEMSKLMTLMVMYEEKGEKDKALLLQEKITQKPIWFY